MTSISRKLRCYSNKFQTISTGRCAVIVYKTSSTPEDLASMHLFVFRELSRFIENQEIPMVALFVYHTNVPDNVDLPDDDPRRVDIAGVIKIILSLVASIRGLTRLYITHDNQLDTTLIGTGGDFVIKAILEGLIEISDDAIGKTLKQLSLRFTVFDHNFPATEHAAVNISGMLSSTPVVFPSLSVFRNMVFVRMVDPRYAVAVRSERIIEALKAVYARRPEADRIWGGVEPHGEALADN